MFIVQNIVYYIDGQMPEWFKGVDCKSIIRGFESLSDLLNKKILKKN